ncbi:FGGY-family carbohydrate kinase [Roseinatronobacter sp.]|uniref:FGGY-family carbohydrate kinase n=1 Tax=Roseinatronobacter sp. TaxID=1945755 RepID=UPI0025CC2982|nr:FGGY-family carbohydrate kinase [Roseibaca sp.]
MTLHRHIAVIDIGKTNAKLALVDVQTLTEIAVVTRPNIVQSGPPWPHYDVEGHWTFLLDALATFHRDHGVDAISITTHGACAALLAHDGSLAAPILDYEHEYPDRIIAEYDAIRPDFAQTGSPKLAGGLNIGAQLHYQFSTDPTLRDRTAQIVTYPQYWGHRLTGVAATDVTSIGCHTDLWAPREGMFSKLPARLGIEGKIAPARKSTEVLGHILPHIAKATGLPSGIQVSVGIHDSNASLYPHILTQRGSFSVVSTGTWVIVMSVGGSDTTLDPLRDTLINVDARGQAVPSARFMGGREFEMIQQGHRVDTSNHNIADVLAASLMILPAVDPRTGPFRGRQMQWSGEEPDVGTGRRSVALSFYLALMTDTCLQLTDASGPTIVEGPFARNSEFVAMLMAATNRPVLTSDAATGTSIGAALLMRAPAQLTQPTKSNNAYNLESLKAYAAKWRSRLA